VWFLLELLRRLAGLLSRVRLSWFHLPCHLEDSNDLSVAAGLRRPETPFSGPVPLHVLAAVELKLSRLLPSSPLSGPRPFKGGEARRLFWICAGSIQPLIYFFVVARKPNFNWIDCSVSECGLIVL
jgi:hypothetical protein